MHVPPLTTALDDIWAMEKICRLFRISGNLNVNKTFVKTCVGHLHKEILALRHMK